MRTLFIMRYASFMRMSGARSGEKDESCDIHCLGEDLEDHSQICFHSSKHCCGPSVFIFRCLVGLL